MHFIGVSFLMGVSLVAQAPEGAQLGGVVLGSDGEPAAGVSVLVRGEDGRSPLGAARSEDDGSWWFHTNRDLPERVVVFAVASDGRASELVKAGLGSPDVHLHLKAPGAIALTARGRRGEQLSVFVHSLRHAAGGHVRVGFRSVTFEGDTLRFEGLPAGLTEVIVNDGPERAGLRRVHVKPGAVAKATITLLQRGGIEGAVVDPVARASWGAPLDGVLLPGAGGERNQNPQRLRQGRLSWQGLPAGAHRLSVRTRDGFELARDVEVLPGRQVDLGELPLVIPTVAGTLGLELTGAAGAVRVVRLLSGSPAIEGGVKPGDLIVSADGTDVTELAVAERVLTGKPGTRVHLEVLRGEETRSLTVERAR
jgi:hypothetical protein